MVGAREDTDRMIHQYWAVNAEIVWATADTIVPQIRAVLTKALDRLR